MRYFLILTACLAHLALPARAWAQEPTIDPNRLEIEVCDDPFGFDGDKDDFKDALLLEAKREAAARFFGELVKSRTTIEDLVVTEERITVDTVGRLRLQEAAQYYSDGAFGEICVRIVVYLTKQDRALFEPKALRDETCKVINPVQNPTFRESLREQGRLNALYAYEPQLEDYPSADVLVLLRRLDYSGSGFVGDTTTYCARIQGEIIPIEVQLFLEHPAQTPTVTPSFTRVAEITTAPHDLPPVDTPRPIHMGVEPSTPTNVSESTSTPIAIATSTHTPTATPMLTVPAVLAPTPVAKYPCPLLISRAQVAMWLVGQTSVSGVAAAINQFNSLRPQDEGAFQTGAPIPVGVIVATNFDEQDGQAWMQFPVRPLTHSGSFGLFETTGSYAAPRPGACMTIVP